VLGGHPAMTAPDARRNELQRNLSSVRQRIALACDAVGRDPAAVTLIAVTKFFPADDAAMLAEAGAADLGESRDQEASEKVHRVAALTAAPVRWHFIGRLQTNKARSVARYADLVHSVDRVELAQALSAGAERVGRVLPVLVQLSLDADPARGGQAAAAMLELAEQVDGLPGLRLDGVMAIAPLEGDPEPAFAELQRVAHRLQQRHPEAAVISAGMSGDLESAIRHGATHVRVGTALLGRRSTNFG
jgi:pyridoxal phosphate enzyme (YggS family)